MFVTHQEVRDVVELVFNHAEGSLRDSIESQKNMVSAYVDQQARRDECMAQLATVLEETRKSHANLWDAVVTETSKTSQLEKRLRSIGQALDMEFGRVEEPSPETSAVEAMKVRIRDYEHKMVAASLSDREAWVQRTYLAARELARFARTAPGGLPYDVRVAAEFVEDATGPSPLRPPPRTEVSR